MAGCVFEIELAREGSGIFYPSDIGIVIGEWSLGCEEPTVRSYILDS